MALQQLMQVLQRAQLQVPQGLQQYMNGLQPAQAMGSPSQGGWQGKTYNPETDSWDNPQQPGNQPAVAVQGPQIGPNSNTPSIQFTPGPNGFVPPNGGKGGQWGRDAQGNWVPQAPPNPMTYNTGNRPPFAPGGGPTTNGSQPYYRPRLTGPGGPGVQAGGAIAPDPRSFGTVGMNPVTPVNAGMQMHQAHMASGYRAPQPWGSQPGGSNPLAVHPMMVPGKPAF